MAEDIKKIFNTKKWILDRYDVTSGQSPLSFFDRVSYLIIAHIMKFILE